MMQTLRYFMLAHGIAHNLVYPHNLEHGFYASAICEAYLEPLFSLLSDGPRFFTHLGRYNEATNDSTARQTMTSPHLGFSPSLFSHQPNEEVASRSETVLNKTMAGIETYLTQKVKDVASPATDHLDGEVEFYEQVSDKELLSFFFKY